MDKITYNGMNFKGTPFGMRIQSVAVSGVSLQPHSIFLFVKHKNTIVFENGGVQIFM